MGILDQLEQAAGLQQAPGAGPAPPEGIVGAVLQMVQSQPGGVAGIVQRFEQAGLGGAAQSWIASGQNQAVTGGDVQAALGPGPVGQVARQVGIGAAGRGEPYRAAPAAGPGPSQPRRQTTRRRRRRRPWRPALLVDRAQLKTAPGGRTRAPFGGSRRLSDDLAEMTAGNV